MKELFLMTSVFASLLLGGCASSPIATDSKKADAAKPNQSVLVKTEPEPSLAPGYLIAIRSSQDQNLNGTFRINSDGELQLPYKVEIDTSQMDFEKLKQTLENTYRPYFKGAPNLGVSVAQKRYWVIANGLVEKPGEILVKRDASLDEIISQAGGLGDEMDNGFIRVRQKDQTIWINLGDYFRYGKSDQVPLWTGGDQLFFQKEGPRAMEINSKGQTKGVSVLGEVKTPGDSTFLPGADFYYYLAKMGGPTPVANLDNVELVRAVDAGTTTKKEIIYSGSAANMPLIQEGDMVIINHDKPTMLERVLTALANAASVVGVVVLALIVK
jgi:protein involved in polysaccharide export with SLBB domain